MTVFTKDPDSTIDFAVDWSDMLASGESITTSAWETDGLTEVSSTSAGNTRAVVLSGGVVGMIYSAVNRVSTDQGRTLEQTVAVRVQGV